MAVDMSAVAKISRHKFVYRA